MNTSRDRDTTFMARVWQAAAMRVPGGRGQPLDKRRLAGAAILFLLTLCGGLIAKQQGMPVAWMLGALCTAAPLALFLPAGHMLVPRVPRSVRNFFVPVIGTMIGSNFTAQLLAAMAEWWQTIAIMCILTPVLQVSLYLWYRGIWKFDPVTAYFSASPGGLVEAIEIGSEKGGDPRIIAAMHFLRIVFSVFGIPVVLVLWARLAPASGDVSGIAGAVTAKAGASVAELLILAVCCIAGARLGKLLRLPAPFMLGPMIISAVLHCTGLVEASVPAPFVATAQWVMGTTLGLQFAGLPRSHFLRIVAAAASGIVVAFAIVIAVVLAVMPMIGVPGEVMLLSFVPGGLVEMGLIALTMGVNPMFVTAHHVLRVFLSVVMTPFLFALFPARYGRGN